MLILIKPARSPHRLRADASNRIYADEKEAKDRNVLIPKPSFSKKVAPQRRMIFASNEQK